MARSRFALRYLYGPYKRKGSQRPRATKRSTETFAIGTQTGVCETSKRSPRLPTPPDLIETVRWFSDTLDGAHSPLVRFRDLHHQRESMILIRGSYARRDWSAPTCGFASANSRRLINFSATFTAVPYAPSGR
jgi:hypothetical protein